MTTAPDGEGAARAWGWVAHLREGGTTPWLDWHGTAPASGRTLPGAQQLELLRRINLARTSAAGSSARARGAYDGLSTRLADRVLTTAAAGRGPVDLPLLGARASSYGPRPVDPGRLGPRELMRVAAVLLAEDLVALGPDPVPSRIARPWRRRHRLIGDPVVVSRLREHLRGRGRPDGGPHPVVVVAAAPLDELLAHTWTQLCFEHGAKPWPEWLRYWREREQLPDRADLAAAVRRWDPQPTHVRVVTDHAQLAQELGVRRLPPVVVPAADQAELARRVAAVVGLLVPAHERPGLMRTLRARLPHTSTPPMAVPPGERDWLAPLADRVARDVRRAGYPVVGDLADLAPRSGRRARAAVPADLDQRVLELAVGMLVDDGWRTDDVTRGGTE